MIPAGNEIYEADSYKFGVRAEVAPIRRIKAGR
jgi:hypothetical protein